MDTLGSAADTRIGSLVEGRYKILEAMAAGSMGAVYKAERVPVGKLVAIKFLHKSFANEPEFLLRFERETRVMSKLAHPNCVSVVDFGVWEEAPYLVMEYVAGTTLRHVLDDGALSPLRALGLMRQIVSGLAHAHSHEIVHRDIKPANIMISDEIGTGEHVRILDFGLARLRTGGGGRDATQTNTVVGTPNYMAPEQTVGGGAIDARTDVYAAGVVLFEMISGERPFVAEETMQLLGMHRAAEIPRLAERVPDLDVPDGVQAIIDRAMAKKPADRFQTAIEMAAAIDEIIDPRPAELRTSGSRPVRRKTDPAIAATLTDVATETMPHHDRPRWRSPVIGALVLLVGIGGSVGYLLWRNAQDHEVVPDGPAAPLGLPIAIDAPPPPDAPIDAPPPSDAAIGDDAPPEIEMDPEKAEDLDPSKETIGEDEAPNAPTSKEDVEKQAPPAPPALATNLHDTVLLIKDGKRELALASLHQLERENPKSAYIPFLQGNLYFDKLWWSVAMDHYQLAIKKNAGYKSNPTIIKNLIRMLASPKTQKSAGAFLKTIGHPAAGLIKTAAKSDPNPIIKKQAKELARWIH